MTVALAAVQVRLEPAELATPAAFRAAMEGHAARAADATADADHRLFVFPESIGHFALLAFAPPFAQRRATVDGVIGSFAASRPLSIARAMIGHRVASLRRGALLALCPQGEELMHRTFGPLARRHRATVVAGSLLRPHDDGSVSNSSFTYSPEGYLRAVVDKVNLVPELEDASPTGLGLSRGDPERLPLVDAGWGKLATLICYDGFCEPHTRGERFAAMGRRVDAAGADVIANPAANPWPWDDGWYFAEPGEQILRRDQWRTEGLPATLGQCSHVRYGVTAHLAGRILDQRFEGRSEILVREGGEVKVLASAATIDQSEVVVAKVAL